MSHKACYEKRRIIDEANAELRAQLATAKADLSKWMGAAQDADAAQKAAFTMLSQAKATIEELTEQTQAFDGQYLAIVAAYRALRAELEAARLAGEALTVTAREAVLRAGAAESSIEAARQLERAYEKAQKSNIEAIRAKDYALDSIRQITSCSCAGPEDESECVYHIAINAICPKPQFITEHAGRVEASPPPREDAKPCGKECQASHRPCNNCAPKEPNNGR